MVVVQGPVQDEGPNRNRNWPAVYDESVKYLNQRNKSPSMMGSIASRLKMLKTKLQEDSRKLNEDSNEELLDQIPEEMNQTSFT